MKTIKFALPALFLCATVFAQTVDLGQGAFINKEGEILIGIDASVAIRKLDAPYVMFVVYLASKNNRSDTVSRDEFYLVYKNNNYPMPGIKELRENYNGQINDTDLYLRMGKESLMMSELRYYRFDWKDDFFPDPRRGQVAIDRGSTANVIGFVTRLYFKNPGFQKGDELAIAIKEKGSDTLKGYCAVVLK